MRKKLKNATPNKNGGGKGDKAKVLPPQSARLSTSGNWTSLADLASKYSEKPILSVFTKMEKPNKKTGQCRVLPEW